MFFILFIILFLNHDDNHYAFLKFFHEIALDNELQCITRKNVKNTNENNSYSFSFNAYDSCHTCHCLMFYKVILFTFSYIVESTSIRYKGLITLIRAESACTGENKLYVDVARFAYARIADVKRATSFSLLHKITSTKKIFPTDSMRFRDYECGTSLKLTPKLIWHVNTSLSLELLKSF